MLAKQCYIIRVCVGRWKVEKGVWCALMGMGFALFRTVHEVRSEGEGEAGKWIVYLCCILLVLCGVEAGTLWRL